MRFKTFDQYVGVLSIEAPHALVQDWWTRLEREIRTFSKNLGYKDKNSPAALIAALGMDPRIDPEIVDELQALRRTRNAVAHDLDAPTLTGKQAEEYVRRAWALSWYLSELR